MPTLRKIKRAATNCTQAHPPPDFRTGDNLKGTFDRLAALKTNFTDLKK